MDTNIDSTSDAIAESRLRRQAYRQGLVLRKSRSRDGWLRGTFMVLDLQTNTIVRSASPDGYGLSLEDVQDLLATGLS